MDSHTEQLEQREDDRSGPGHRGSQDGGLPAQQVGERGLEDDQEDRASVRGGADDRRAEYEALRAEILYADQVCLVITGALLSGSLALLTFVVDTLKEPDLAALLSPVWLIGYSYISEKRFVIETVAIYMRRCVEPKSEFGWETWLFEERQGRARFRRVFPFYLETLMSIAAVLALPGFLCWQHPGPSGWGFYTSLFFILPMAVLVCYNVWAYAKRTK